MSLDRAVADIRRAVRDAVTDVSGLADRPGQPDWPVVVACSGGADSMALLAATVFEAEKAGRSVTGVCVDHQLQAGSAAHTERIVERMRAVGAHDSVSVAVGVEPDSSGLEAAARAARYAALTELAERADAEAVLLGHTADDQAETVLLGLARGSGARSLAGMPAVSGRYRRPLLGVSRSDTERACRAQGIEFWSDPHNDDERFTRVRVRKHVLPTLEKHLGPGVAKNLTRTASALRTDSEALDQWADLAFAQCHEDGAITVSPLLELPSAIRTRVLRLAALEAGALAAELSSVHIGELDRAVCGGRGGHTVQLPGHVTATLCGGALSFGPTGAPS